ncbi:G-protein coupled receptor Mth2 [Eumeta japonica]|uniref:G-protein coupled receptor Mth2 n=1 Tax=Eumeta variegata TaxID=151549 RepID=A0A4C1WFS8_EUMVA|nr:G-protein coupled receptor Mth2 [Eumeta japonica]
MDCKELEQYLLKYRGKKSHRGVAGLLGRNRISDGWALIKEECVDGTEPIRPQRGPIGCFLIVNVSRSVRNSGYRGSSRSRRRELERFAAYGLYAWGVPLLLTAVTALMQFVDGLPAHAVRPNFGKRRCWFEDWISELVYFMTPVLALVVVNITFFAVTAKRIYSIRQETAILKSSESSRSDKLRRDKQRYGLYLKLFIVMGINWSLELISFAVGGSNLYWIVIDLSNITLGIFIFVIFVWRNKAWSLLRKRVKLVDTKSKQIPISSNLFPDDEIEHEKRCHDRPDIHHVPLVARNAARVFLLSIEDNMYTRISRKNTHVNILDIFEILLYLVYKTVIKNFPVNRGCVRIRACIRHVLKPYCVLLFRQPRTLAPILTRGPEPTEDTRVTSDDGALRFKDLH